MQGQGGLLSSPYDFQEIEDQPNRAPTPQPKAQPKGSFLGRAFNSVVHPAIQTGADVSNFVDNRGLNVAHALGLAKGTKQQTSKQQFQDTAGKLPGGSIQNNTPKQFAGNLAQTAALAAPGAEGLGVGGRVVEGAVQGAVSGAGAAAANNSSAGGILKGGLLGAGTGGAVGGASSVLGGLVRGSAGAAPSIAEDAAQNIGNKAETAAKTAGGAATSTTKPGNFLQNLSTSLKKSVVNPKVAPSPFGSAKENNIVKYLSDNNLIKAGDSAKTIYGSLQGHYSDLQNQINDSLGKENAVGSVEDVKQAIADKVGTTNKIGLTDPARQELVTDVQNELDKRAAQNGGQLSTADKYNYKNDVQDAMGKAFDKVDKGGTMTAKEAQLGDVRNALDDMLPDDIKGLSKGQSMLYDAAPGLAKSASTPLSIRTPTLLGTLPGIRIPSQGAANILQSAKTRVASSLEGAGNALQGAGNVAAGASDSTIGRGLAAAASHAAIPAVVGATAQMANSPKQATTPDLQQPQGQQGSAQSSLSAFGGPSEDQAQSGSSSDNPIGVSSDQIAQEMVQDLQQTGGKNLSKLNTLYSIAKESEKASQPKSLTSAALGQQQGFQDALNATTGIRSAFANTTGTGEGVLSKVLANGTVGSLIGGSNVQNVNNSISAALPSIAKALGSGTSAPELKAIAKQYLPTTSDTQSQANAKLDNLEAILKNNAQQYFQSQSSYVNNDNSNDEITALMGSLGSQ